MAACALVCTRALKILSVGYHLRIESSRSGSSAALHSCGGEHGALPRAVGPMRRQGPSRATGQGIGPGAGAWHAGAGRWRALREATRRQRREHWRAGVRAVAHRGPGLRAASLGRGGRSGPAALALAIRFLLCFRLSVITWSWRRSVYRDHLSNSGRPLKSASMFRARIASRVNSNSFAAHSYCCFFRAALGIEATVARGTTR